MTTVSGEAERAFKPSMTSRIEGITVLDPLQWRAWSGIVADVWHAACAPGARGEYVSRDPRLFIVLEREGSPIALKLAARGAALPPCHAAQYFNFVPAGVPLWSEVSSPLRLRHLDIHFDASTLAARLGDEFDEGQLDTLRLGLVDDALLSLARLVAAECAAPGFKADLYGDGLTLALLIRLLRLGGDMRRPGTRLTARQLKRVTDHLEEHCLRGVRLQDLADLVGLSQSHFSRAFKAATGVPPYQWHMQARIRRVQTMLADGLPLNHIAAQAGFADQAHFTRVFRRIVGATPAAWRRERAS